MPYGFQERIGYRTMAKMASLHAEGLTDEDLETAEIAAILEEMFVD